MHYICMEIMDMHILMILITANLSPLALLVSDASKSCFIEDTGGSVATLV